MKRVLFSIIFSLSATFAFAGPASKRLYCSSVTSVVTGGKTGAGQKLTKLLKLQWENMMVQEPEFATYVGYPGQNDRWSDRSLAGLEREEKEIDCTLEALKKIPRAKLSKKDQITFDLAQRDLEQSIEGRRFGGKYLVLDHMGGLHGEVVDMISSMPQQNKKDYENILARLEKVPVLEEQTEVLLREGLKRKITPVKMFLSRVPAQFDAILTAKVKDSPLYAPFNDIRIDLPATDKAVLQQRALEVIEKKTYPALQKLKSFLEKEYIPGAREFISFSEMPEGKAWYAYKVKTNTTTSLTPEELHELGLKEVARITREMERVKERVQFKGDLHAFNQFLLTDARFFYKDRDELLNAYRAIGKRIDPELPKLFKTLPRLPYGVREIPEYKAKDSPTAYYEGGSLEGGRAGYFVANTYDLKARPKWGMEALTLHEAVPGHHLQISLAQEIPDLPEFRRHGGYTAYTEGWGLYGEYLGTEIGMYQDPYSKYGQLTYEMWRAVRLVVDTGIHSKAWSRQQAIDYFMNAMPKSRLEAEVEVDRYITWPGQALAYKVGELKFRELREKAKARLGARFDVREFHDQVLKNGALPMDVLEKIMEEWMDARR